MDEDAEKKSINTRKKEAFQLNKSCQMQRQGILSVEEAQFNQQVTGKGSVDTISQAIFPCSVMSSSFVLQRNQNEKLDIQVIVCHVLLQSPMLGYF